MRIVPSTCAVSGITLFVVPAQILATVTTAGSNTSIRRVIIVWSAPTISQATGTGSRVWCGALAWPPAPVTVMRSTSLAASIGPLRARRRPLGSIEVMWMANAALDRGGSAVVERRQVEQALVEHEPGAVVALLAGLEHEQHSSGQLVPAAAEQAGGAGEHRGVRVVPAGVHAPVHVRGEVEAGVLRHRQRVHVAAQQDRRPGLRAGQQGGDARRGVVERDVERETVECGQHRLAGDRQVVADLGPAVQGTAQLDRDIEQAPGLLHQIPARHGATVQLAQMLLPRETAPRKEPAAAGRARAYYDRALSGVRSRRTISLVAVAVVGVLGLAAGSQLIGNRPVVPTLPDRTLLVQWDSMAGASNDEVRRVASKASDELRALPGVSGVGGHIGRAITSDQVVGNSSAELWVSVSPTANFGETERAIRDVVQGYPGIAHNVVNYSQQQIGDMHSTMEPGFAVRVYGTEMPILREKAEEVRKALENIDGVKNPAINATAMTPVVEVEVNLEAAQKVGIKPGDARRAAATLMQGIVVGNLFEEQKVFEVVVRGAVDVRDDLTSIRELLLDTPTGGHVQLGEIATIRMVPNEVVVMHDDTSRRIDVVADVSGRPLADVQRDIEAAIKQIQFPLEYHAEIPTKYGQVQAADTLVLWLAAAALLGVLLLLQTAVRSWKLALAIFLALPAALAGAAVAAWIGSGALSGIVMTAFAAVLAIAARNATLLSARVDELWRSQPQSSRADSRHDGRQGPGSTGPQGRPDHRAGADSTRSVWRRRRPGRDHSDVADHRRRPRDHNACGALGAPPAGPLVRSPYRTRKSGRKCTKRKPPLRRKRWK